MAVVQRLASPCSWPLPRTQLVLPNVRLRCRAVPPLVVQAHAPAHTRTHRQWCVRHACITAAELRPVRRRHIHRHPSLSTWYPPGTATAATDETSAERAALTAVAALVAAVHVMTSAYSNNCKSTSDETRSTPLLHLPPCTTPATTDASTAPPISAATYVASVTGLMPKTMPGPSALAGLITEPE